MEGEPEVHIAVGALAIAWGDVTGQAEGGGPVSSDPVLVTLDQIADGEFGVVGVEAGETAECRVRTVRRGWARPRPAGGAWRLRRRVARE